MSMEILFVPCPSASGFPRHRRGDLRRDFPCQTTFHEPARISARQGHGENGQLAGRQQDQARLFGFRSTVDLYRRYGDIDIFSLGADGQPGGEGVNADIGSWNLDN